ncbi:MAG: DNA methyltransferase [Myxococcota bacterium]
MGRIIHGDNLDVLPTLADGSFDLVYIDPPFNTGKEQRRTRLSVKRDDEGDRVGFAGRRYRSVRLGSLAFEDVFSDFLAFIEPRLRHAHRLLNATGSFFLHIDYREAHYCKVLLDSIFGRECFLNEIIWAYDYGGRPKRRWPAKHDTLLWYVRDPKRYTFNYDAIDRIPYMAPRLVGAEKAARGKTPTDVWWQTIVPTSGRERTGYPTQKPLRILERIIAVHSDPGHRVLDFFAGSGTTGEAAARAERDFVLVDRSEEAIEVMMKRLAFAEPTLERFGAPPSESTTDEAAVAPSSEPDESESPDPSPPEPSPTQS